MKKADMTLSTVVKMVIVLVVLAILLFIAYRYLLKGTQDNLNPLEDAAKQQSCCARQCLGGSQPKDCAIVLKGYTCDCTTGDANPDSELGK